MSNVVVTQYHRGRELTQSIIRLADVHNVTQVPDNAVPFPLVELELTIGSKITNIVVCGSIAYFASLLSAGNATFDMQPAGPKEFQELLAQAAEQQKQAAEAAKVAQKPANPGEAD